MGSGYNITFPHAAFLSASRRNVTTRSNIQETACPVPSPQMPLCCPQAVSCEGRGWGSAPGLLRHGVPVSKPAVTAGHLLSLPAGIYSSRGPSALVSAQAGPAGPRFCGWLQKRVLGVREPHYAKH